jgi:hypothetical protein
MIPLQQYSPLGLQKLEILLGMTELSNLLLSIVGHGIMAFTADTLFLVLFASIVGRAVETDLYRSDPVIGAIFLMGYVHAMLSWSRSYMATLLEYL